MTNAVKSRLRQHVQTMHAVQFSGGRTVRMVRHVQSRDETSVRTKRASRFMRHLQVQIICLLQGHKPKHVEVMCL